MLNLEPLIARFVDDVLRAIRAASLNELRGARGPERVMVAGQSRRAPAPRKARRAVPKRRLPEQARVLRESANVRARARVQRPAPSIPASEPESPEVAEITDPEGLLASSPLRNSAPVSPAGPSAGPVSEPPPSAQRLVDEPGVALRQGETLVRADGAAVVIRRAKRA
jgi:hypothetical protein